MIGALLTGGKSSRMGQEKAQMIYRDSITELNRLYQLLEQHCSQVTLCHRSEQDHGLPKVVDPGNGPLSAIHSIQQAYPGEAILVIACDLPLLESEDLEFIIKRADTSKAATCYISRYDNLPEPLCAIYQPSSAAAITQAVQQQAYCPRNVLGTLDIQLIETRKPSSLMNANTPADRLEVLSYLNGTRTDKTLQLRYFAQLKEQADLSEEVVTSAAVTASGLYEELKAKYNFSYKQRSLMVAINEEFSSWDQPLAEGDEVVFIPPVAGG